MILKKVFVRAPYNYDGDAVSDETGFKCDEPSMAQQQFKEESDINEIVRKFGVTGELPSNIRAPQYGDFTGIFDYHSAMNAVVAARDSFNAMPAEVRARFDNDPAAFVEFCSDEANRDEAKKLGLLMPGETAPEVLEAVVESPKAAE
jgi:phage internal scaffolding protein